MPIWLWWSKPVVDALFSSFFFLGRLLLFSRLRCEREDRVCRQGSFAALQPKWRELGKVRNGKKGGDSCCGSALRSFAKKKKKPYVALAAAAAFPAADVCVSKSAESPALLCGGAWSWRLGLVWVQVVWLKPGQMMLSALHFWASLSPRLYACSSGAVGLRWTLRSCAHALTHARTHARTTDQVAKEPPCLLTFQRKLPTSGLRTPLVGQVALVGSSGLCPRLGVPRRYFSHLCTFCFSLTMCWQRGERDRERDTDGGGGAENEAKQNQARDRSGRL